MKHCNVLLLLLAALLGSAVAWGQEWRLLDVDELSMSYGKIANNRSAYYPYADAYRAQPGQERWDYMVDVQFDLALAKYGDYGLHWANKVEGCATDVQFRSVAWDFRWGLQLGRKLEVFYSHRSAHVLDAEPAEPRTYDLRNIYGAQVIFYRRQP